MGTRVRFLSIFLIVSILLAGCGTMDMLPATPVLEPCVPNTEKANPYRAEPEEWIKNIYLHAAGNKSDSVDKTLYAEARSAAYRALGHQTDRWSDSVDIELPETGKVRFTLTYLSPQLIQTIYLNQLLIRNITGEGEAVTERFKSKLEGFAQRNEMLFLLTVTTNQSASATQIDNPVTMDIPLPNMMMINMSNIAVPPLHDDHSLDLYNRLNHGKFSGLVTYQLGYKDGDTCKAVLDPRVDVNISINIPNLKLNDKDQPQQTWTILYTALIDDETNNEIPNYELLNPMPDGIYYGPTDAAPVPALESPTYWQEMGSYIWKIIIPSY